MNSCHRHTLLTSSFQLLLLMSIGSQFLGSVRAAPAAAVGEQIGSDAPGNKGGLQLPQGGIFGHLSTEQVDKLLSDSVLVKKQILCVLNQGTCDQTGKQLKVAIPEVLIRQCRSCNPNQSENARKVMQHIQDNYPQEWTLIQEKYKPKRPHTAKT